MIREEVLKILKENHDKFFSGEDLSKKFEISRAAIWKHIKSLKEDGYDIESVSRKGYRLINCADILTYEEIKKYLNTDFIGRSIIHYDTIDSTNLQAKKMVSSSLITRYEKLGKVSIDSLNIKDGTVLISEEQIKGRGRLGRAWESPKGTGIWFSIILRPNISPMRVSNITLLGAAAVNLALKELNIESQIKWPNDILINNKKVCGILTEMSAELDEINYIIMGIGINVNMDLKDFSEDLRNKATSLKSEYKREFSRKEIIGKVLNYFERMYKDYVEKGSLEECINICRKNSILIGKEVYIKEGGQNNKVAVLDISSEGALVVERENKNIEHILCGEVSMEGIYDLF